MRKITILSAMLLLAICGTAQEIDTVNFETFEYKAEDSTVYMMQKYFIVFLKRGDSRSQDKEEAAKIQKGHLSYLGGLYEKGYICMNGPFGSDGAVRGATVYRVATEEEALKLASEDPAVKAGRLQVEVHPWWLARGTGVR